jgi:transketolase
VPGGNYLYYGVREFAMTAIANGLALHGGLIPYTATFLVFSDYARNAIRMAALMKLRQIMVYTHDSIGLGEDGPTHQPIEHVACLRLIPNVDVWRPADASETASPGWRPSNARRTDDSRPVAAEPADRQRRRSDRHVMRRGAYVLADCATPQVILIATGSEVKLALDAARHWLREGSRARLVSMPCAEVFDRQDAAYREAVLPRGAAAPGHRGRA